MGRLCRIWLVGFRFFRSMGEDVASFCQADYRSFTKFSGVREARLRDVRSDMLFAPHGHHVRTNIQLQMNEYVMHDQNIIF